jgi:DNA-binding transcriptional LysR family regulator
VIDFLNRHGFSFDRLRGFVAVVDAGSITAAAPGNDSRQTLLRRQLRDLEECFGQALVDRRGNAVTCTAAGREVAILAREMFARLRDVGAMADGGLVDVALGTGDSVIRWWVIPHRHAFGASRLNVTMLPAAGVVAGLLDAQLDFGILRANDLHRGLSSRLLGTVEYALYVPDVLKPKGKPLGVKKLLETLPIGVLTGEPSFSAQLDAALVRANVRYTPAFLCDTFPQLHIAVKAGQCAAVLPTLVRDELPSSAFSEYRDPILGKHESRVYLAWMKRLERQRPRVAALIPGIVQGMQR